MNESGTSIVINLLLKKMGNPLPREKELISALVNDRMNPVSMKFILTQVNGMKPSELEEVVRKLDRLIGDVDYAE